MMFGRLAVAATLVAGSALFASPASAAPIDALHLASPRAVPTSPIDITRSKWQRNGQTYRTNVSWKPPADTGGWELSGYEIEVERDGEVILELEVANPTIILRKLIRGTTYTVSVRAVNEDGASDPVTLEMTVPGLIPPDDGGSDPGELAGPRPRITAVTPDKGRAGSFITITGDNLDNLRYIRVGSRLAGFYINSSAQLIVTVPPGSGTVDVQVMTLGGQYTAKKAFTYTGR
jgi:hypothetical protein